MSQVQSGRPLPNRITVSLDFELGWGSIENGKWREREKAGVYRELRPQIGRLAAFIEAREIPLTWAVVGGMADDASASDFDHLPLDARPHYASFLREAENDTKDGSDLLDRLQSLRTKQDLGSHSYSHLRFDWPGYDHEARRRDLELSRDALASRGIDAKSFVYPLNIIDDHAAATEAGIKTARLPAPMAATKAGKLLSRTLTPPPAAQRTEREDGLILDQGSMLFVWGTKSDWRLRKVLVLRQARLGLERAKRGGGDLHLWLHPFNLVEVNGLFDELCSFLDEAATLRDSGKILIEPMVAADRLPNVVRTEAAHV